MRETGTKASFASPSHALECGVAVQQALAERNEASAEPVGVRIGLNAGEPPVEESDLFGTAVQLEAALPAIGTKARP